MKQDFLYRTNLQYEVKSLRKQVADFQSGEIYINIQKAHRKIVARMQRQMKQLKKELASAHAKIIDVRNKWFQTCEDVLKEKEQELKKKDKELHKMAQALFEAQRQRDDALDKAHEKNVELYEVKGELEEALEKIHALTARINKDYTNSSTPSSSTPNHKTVANSREKSSQKPGAQTGHIHNGRKELRPTTTIEIPAPERYTSDPNFKPTGKTISKQLVKLRVCVEVIEYTTPEFRNQTTGQRVHAEFPKGLKDELTYDGSVKAAAYILNNECNVSIKKVKTFLKGISEGRLDLSTGMICNLSRQFSQKTEDERSQIFMELLASERMHSDFTFGRMNGKQAAVIICATPETVLYQGRETKGDEGVKGSPLELYEGIVISDHEAALIKHGSKHQECMAHIERYVRGSIENEPERTWNKRMLAWIKAAIGYWRRVREGEPEDAETVKQLECGYDAIMEKAKEEYEYIPPGKYNKDGYNLYSRMAAEPECYRLFLHDTSVSPTNNLAERLARQYKRKSAQVMCFRSQEGVNNYCDGLSMIQTLKARGKEVHETVARIFNKGMEI